MDIPTALSQREADLLKELSNRRRVVEIGSLFGYSTIKMAKKAKEVISIDPHEGYPCPDAPSTWNQFLHNIEGHNIKPIKSVYQNVEMPQADMAFIDINGKYETTKNCLLKLQHVPIIVVHDLFRQRCGGVEKALKDLYNNIDRVDSCAIVRNI